MTVYVSEFNDASINLHEGLGFQTEGRLRRVIHTRGRYYDQLMFGLLSEEYRTQFPTA